VTSHATAVYALILAGGAGTRFWPASRADRPKQFLPLLGGDPLLRETVKRILPICGDAAGAGARWDRVMISTNRRLAERTRVILPELATANILIEPVPRGTAPCIGWAAAQLARRDPEAVLMVLPSDHHVADVERFRETVTRAVASAAAGVITTIGIPPTSPETGYGYLEIDAEMAAPVPGAFAGLRFVEKPDRARAEELLAGGRHLWNAGMFFFRACDILEAIRVHLPALGEGLDAIDRAAAAGAEEEAVERIFPTLPAVSIDCGVMERLAGFAVIPGDFGWRDLGTWSSAWELAPKDALGNSSPKGTIVIGAHDNEVVDLRTGGDRRIVALVGVHDLVVVETDDALLLVTREQAQDVRDVVACLKAQGDERFT
jgi:mannose-1-phosphate guanylyltransferase